mgnify:FL=1
MRRITIDNPKFEGTPLNMVKVESTKQSLFVQVHVVADSILTLRIPLLYEVWTWK